MEINKALIHFFREKILYWHQEINSRRHPWSEDKDPYKIWLSEIILQQTRLAQGLPYFHRFVEKYPTITALAAAPDEEVFLLWQGLGYYSRCRNLLHAARLVANEKNGQFPKSFDEIIQLKGVGPYTAAAIASFAFDLPFAVLDGNVFRVLARFMAFDTPIDSTEGKKMFQKRAQDFLDKKHPAEYNQALMDFGATVCTPQNPDCENCLLAINCRAYAENKVEILPIKQKKLKIKERHFHYFLLLHEGRIFLQQRQKKDIWQNLFELYLIETDQEPDQEKSWKSLQPFTKVVEKNIFQSRQRLTHQLIISRFHFAELSEIPSHLMGGKWIEKKEWRQFALPKTVLIFLEQLPL